LTLRSLAKRILPKSLVYAIRWRAQPKTVEEHSRMSREQVEMWLGDRYAKDIGASLNLEAPRRYTEKIQWCKLHAMDATKSRLADKLAVRDWVAERVGDRYLIPLLGAWTDPDEIDFTQLPESFVLKTNNGSGANIIVKDKAKLDEASARMQLRRWASMGFGWLLFEPQYLSIPPRIVGESYLCNADGSEINDYKFLCFAGEPRFVRVDVDRHSNHSRIIFDAGWNIQPWNQGYYPAPLSVPKKPDMLEEMLSLARVLSADFAHVRVDLYEVDGRIFFGEMTFTSGAGFERVIPDEYDYVLGDMWDLEREPRCEFPYAAGVRVLAHEYSPI